MGTIGVTQTPGIRDRLAARKPGAVFADAPVPGSNPAGPGQLLILASGPAAAADTVGPVSGITGRKTVQLGETGRGSQVKLAVDAYMSVLTEGAAGRWHRQTDWASATRAWPRSSRAARWTRRCQAPQDRPARLCAGVPLEWTLKDADLALCAAGGADLPLLAALSRRWHAAVDTGHGREDISAARLALRQPGTD